MSDPWRLLDTGALPAAENMAIDEALLRARGEGQAPDTLRFLAFSPHCALLGYHQNAEEELYLDFCRQRGIEVNRRLTGGGAIYCDTTQVGWELVMAEEALPYPPGSRELDRFVCQGAVLGLQRLGVRAEFCHKNDIEVGGRKIGGTGGVSLGGAFLIHGSILVCLQVEAVLGALRVSAEKLSDKGVQSVRQRLTCLAEELGGRRSPAM